MSENLTHESLNLKVAAPCPQLSLPAASKQCGFEEHPFTQQPHPSGPGPHSGGVWLWGWGWTALGSLIVSYARSPSLKQQHFSHAMLVPLSVLSDDGLAYPFPHVKELSHSSSALGVTLSVPLRQPGESD